jgi:hypothetical protein
MTLSQSVILLTNQQQQRHSLSHFTIHYWIECQPQQQQHHQSDHLLTKEHGS